MYCTVTNLTQLLPNNIKINDDNLGTPSPGRPTTKDGVLTSDQAARFITLSQQEIDARLSSFYITPLKMVKVFEESLAEDALAGNNVEIRLWSTAQFSVGDSVRFQSYSCLDTATIVQVINMTTFVVDKLKYSFYTEDGVAGILKFPDPIPLIAARLAVSYAFDELYSAEQSPDVSNYGVEQRKMANNSIDNIMDGSTSLFGQEKTGRRFVNGNLFDAYSNPTVAFQFGREKS